MTSRPLVAPPNFPAAVTWDVVEEMGTVGIVKVAASRCAQTPVSHCGDYPGGLSCCPSQKARVSHQRADCCASRMYAVVYRMVLLCGGVRGEIR